MRSATAKRELPDHEVRTVAEAGWAGKRNGDLIRLMREAGIEALVTVDQSIEFQNNLRTSGIAVVLLVARTNRLEALLPLVAELRTALSAVRAGDMVRVGI